MSAATYNLTGWPGRSSYAVARWRADRTAPLYRKRLVRTDFSIVCANCWGSEIYRHVGIPYRTPFVGMIIDSHDYLIMLRDLRRFVAAPFEWVELSKYESINELRLTGARPHYPIGRLPENVEVHFLHYKTDTEAEDRWRRRAERINWNNLLVSLVEYSQRDAEILHAFESLSYERKVIITPHDRRDTAFAIRVRGSYSNAVSLYYQGLSQFDVVRWINDGSIAHPPPRGRELLARAQQARKHSRARS